MLYKTVTLKNGQTSSLSWLEEGDLPEVMEAINSDIKFADGTYADRVMMLIRLTGEKELRGGENE